MAKFFKQNNDKIKSKMNLNAYEDDIANGPCCSQSLQHAKNCGMSSQEVEQEIRGAMQETETFEPSTSKRHLTSSETDRIQMVDVGAQVSPFIRRETCGVEEVNVATQVSVAFLQKNEVTRLTNEGAEDSETRDEHMVSAGSQMLFSIRQEASGVHLANEVSKVSASSEQLVNVCSQVSPIIRQDAYGVQVVHAASQVSVSSEQEDLVVEHNFTAPQDNIATQPAQLVNIASEDSFCLRFQAYGLQPLNEDSQGSVSSQEGSSNAEYLSIASEHPVSSEEENSDGGLVSADLERYRHMQLLNVAAPVSASNQQEGAEVERDVDVGDGIWETSADTSEMESASSEIFVSAEAENNSDSEAAATSTPTDQGHGAQQENRAPPDNPVIRNRFPRILGPPVDEPVMYLVDRMCYAGLWLYRGFRNVLRSFRRT